MRRFYSLWFLLAFLFVSLVVAGGIVIAQTLMPCSSADDPTGRVFCSSSFRQDTTLDFDAASPITGTIWANGISPNMWVEKPSMPVGGKLPFVDLVKIEKQAFKVLAKYKQWRIEISPHLGKDSFDQLVRKFDVPIDDGRTGFNKPLALAEGKSLQQLLDEADRDLRQTRDLYAHLTVYADESRFRSTNADQDPDSTNPTDYLTLCKISEDVVAATVDRCNFAERMRESVRELAYLRMIFGQQFTADAMGLHFDAGEIIGGEAFVRDEVKKLELAVSQYQRAEEVLEEGMRTGIGDSCFVSDFYSQREWALVSRAVEGLERAQHQIAVRKSYLDDAGPKAAMQTYQTTAAVQYVQLLGNAGLNSRSAGGCLKGIRPDGDHIAKMVSQMLDTRQNARSLAEGRNIFGFNVQFTPARPYRTAVGSNDTGLWDEASAAADQAKLWQNDEGAASRQFDMNKDILQNEIKNVKITYDKRLLDLTGCSRNNFPNDIAFFDCVEGRANVLRNCNVIALSDADYKSCVGAVPTGLLRQAWDSLRGAYLGYVKATEAYKNTFRRMEVETDRNATVKDAVLTNGIAQSIIQFQTALIESVNVSMECCFFPSSSVSFNPFAPQIGLLRASGTMAQTMSEIEINSANSSALIRNLLIDQSVLDVDRRSAANEFDAQAVQFETLAAEAKDIVIEAKRSRAYLESSPANDPSYRLVRDSARLRLAGQLEYAARVSYLAAKRAEYEFATRLSANNFRISDIYRARTADDIKKFLIKLKAVTDSLVVLDAETAKEDFNISIAKNVLGLTDDFLSKQGIPANQIANERKARFRKWAAANTVKGADGKDVLRFTVSTSLVDKGIFSSVIQQGYDLFWLHKMGGIGQPKSDNSGFTVLLQSDQQTTGSQSLTYRRIAVTQGGLVHLRARSGCVFDYRLIHPAALLGLEWPSNQPAESATTNFKAGVNAIGSSERSPAFLGRPVSATEWQFELFAGAPQNDQTDMDIQLLRDIEIHMSTVKASRQPDSPPPPPSDCVRIDF